MKSIILIIALIAAVQSFPKGEELKFKRIYVDPLLPTESIVPRIVNGHEAVPHSIPYQVYLIITDDRGSRWLCGGSLISPKFVLTAAHCVVDSVSADVYLGVHNTQIAESTRIIVTSRKLKNHEKFDENIISNDIGLIELPTPVQLNDNINVAPLPSREDINSFQGANARVSGWGLTNGHGSVSPVLLEVNSTVISNRQCNNYFGIIEDSHVCISGSGGVSACNGDSGGPLIASNVQIGIVSFGIEYCESGYPSAFTRVSSFLDWIEANTDLKF